jgi:hypothetical protein
VDDPLAAARRTMSSLAGRVAVPAAATRASVAVWVGAAEVAAVAGLALLALTIAVILGLFVDRGVSSEEPPLFNPPYEFAHTGHLKFPDYAFFFGPRMFDVFVVHPPAHYGFVGLGLRLGAGVRLAEALPILVTIALALWLLLTSRLSLFTRIATAFALAALCAFAVTYDSDSSFGVRPELHVAVTWIAGLLALEGARRRGWHLPRAFLGASLLLLTSMMQWFAVFAFVGVAIYAIAAVHDLGLRRARRVLAALGAGVGVFGIPYLVVFVAPDWDVIRVLSNAGWSGSSWGLWNYNYDVDQSIRTTVWPALHSPLRWTVGAPALAYATRLPPFVAAEALLLARRETRLLALASLPLPLWLFLATPGKGYYGLPETLLALIAATAVVGAVVARVAAFGGRTVVAAAAVAFAAFLGWGAWVGTPELAARTFSHGVLPTPLEIGRAAGRAIVGPDALVTSQHQLWYISGARYWHDFNPDLIGRNDISPGAYFRRFQYVADVPTLFFAPNLLHPYPRNSVAYAEYASGDLRLAGFYADTYSYGYTVFRTGRSRAVRGFARFGSTMYAFRSRPRGPYFFSSVICPLGDDGSGEIASTPSLQHLTGSSGGDVELRFPITIAYAKLPPPTKKGAPTPSSPAPLHSIEGVLVPADRYAEEKRTAPPGCHARDTVRGTLTTSDAYDLPSRLNSHDLLVAIYRTVTDAVVAHRHHSSAVG